MRILGIRVDEIKMAAALDFIAAAIADYAKDRRLRHIVTINPEGIYLAQSDKALAKIVEQADLVTADGSGILWAARRLGHTLPERVTGIDLLTESCALSAKEGFSIYLLGAKPGVAELAAQKLTQTYPGLRIAGLHHGYFHGEEETGAVLADIRSAAPQLLYVALGMPAQERFIAAHRQELGAAVAIGVGGSLDVVAGLVKRAPLMMQRARLEWLWRLMKQPSRLPRMMAIPKFMWAVISDKDRVI